jgi:general secretion pathway protein I
MTDVPPATRETTSGFTLIEVLVAFTIAALMLGALSQVFSTGIGAAALANADKEALLLAQSSLDELGAGGLLSPRETTDRVGDKYTRTVIVRARNDLGSNSKIGPQLLVFEAEVIISWKSALRTRSISLQTMRLSRASS